MDSGPEDSDILSLARQDRARGSLMSPSVVSLALFLTRYRLRVFSADHYIDQIGPLDEEGWFNLIDMANRIDIFLCFRPRLAEILKLLPRYPRVDLGDDGYVFLIDFLSILGLRSEFEAGPRQYLQRKINIALQAMDVDIAALRGDLFEVAKEIGARAMPFERESQEAFDVSIGLVGTELQTAWELARVLDVIEPVRATHGDTESESASTQARGEEAAGSV
ncbi:MAG TPA: hypothetical protein VGO04_10570 [Ensifer sp.]|jgi:hypothetical protein|uniref:hypothetical protein n=1 Tax=Ensifer sp. TaxID=1872086 RepID=UPI002E1665DB|nr:hypothetical protein [Ensifer sp.]